MQSKLALTTLVELINSFMGRILLGHQYQYPVLPGTPFSKGANSYLQVPFIHREHHAPRHHDREGQYGTSLFLAYDLQQQFGASRRLPVHITYST